MKRVMLWGLVLAALAAGAWYGLKPATSSADITELAREGRPDPAMVSAQVISQEDLPPAGTRSLFDHLITQHDGLPYPFEKLVKLVQAQHPDGQLPVAVLIPNGRSLLKAQATNAHPRALIAADFELANKTGLAMTPRGQLFMGFVEKANEIEVLSYNEAAGRFEFQLVQNYCAGCVPRIVYARRAICTTCHQGGGPIFPQRPWNETNGQQDTAGAIAAARGNAHPYMGIPLQQPLAMPERFDQLTDQGSFINVTQRLWLDGCGADGNDCRRLMLKLALHYADSPGSFDAAGADAQRLRELQRRHFPKNGIAVPESDLPNRDPLGERRGLKGWWQGLWTREIKPGEGARDNEDLAAFDKLPKLPVRLDPLTPRVPKQVLTAEDIDGVYGLAALFSESDLRGLGEGSGFDIRRLAAKVDVLPDSHFAARPFVRVDFMRALLAREAEYCCLNTVEMSPPVVSGLPPLKIVKQAVLHDFERYCFACHRGNPALRLDFMAGASEDAVLENIRGKTLIRDALDWERYEGTDKAAALMPPRDSLQYQAMKQAGAEGERARAAMRGAVPGLFGF